MARKMTDAQMDELERAMDARVPYATIAELRKDIVALRSRVGRQRDELRAGRGYHNALVAEVDALRETVQKHTAQLEDCESPALDTRADIAVLRQEYIALRYRVDEQANNLCEARRRSAMHGLQIAAIDDEWQTLREEAAPSPPEPECVCARELATWENMAEHAWPWHCWDCPRHGRIHAKANARIP